MPIGDYPDRLTVLVPQYAKEATYGQAAKSYANGAAVWGRIEEASADQSRGFNQIESRAEVVVTLRGRLDVSASGRLRAARDGLVYQITGVRQSITETVCTCHRLTEA